MYRTVERKVLSFLQPQAKLRQGAGAFGQLLPGGGAFQGDDPPGRT